MKKDSSKSCERPDLEYNGLKIDLSSKEWVIVGIIVILVCWIIYR